VPFLVALFVPIFFMSKSGLAADTEEQGAELIHICLDSPTEGTIMRNRSIFHSPMVMQHPSHSQQSCPFRGFNALDSECMHRVRTKQSAHHTHGLSSIPLSSLLIMF
jgi:hypothetical protein